MKKEIEAKILEVDVEVVTKKLLALGAKLVFDGEMTADYFEATDGSLKEKGIVLRLRKEGDRSVLCLKANRQNTQVRTSDEYEVSVSDYETTKQILGLTGFSVKKHDERRRIIYKFEDSQVDFSIYPDIPPFMEIESPSEDKIRIVAQSLGFRTDQLSRMTGGEVFAHYKKMKREH